MTENLHHGSIYTYKGEVVRLRQRIGAIVSLRKPHGASFLGRADLLQKASKTAVKKFVARCH